MALWDKVKSVLGFSSNNTEAEVSEPIGRVLRDFNHRYVSPAPAEVTQDFQEAAKPKRKELEGPVKLANYMKNHPGKEEVTLANCSQRQLEELQQLFKDAGKNPDDLKLEAVKENGRGKITVKGIDEAVMAKLEGREQLSPMQKNMEAIRDQAAAEGQDVKKPGKLARIVNRAAVVITKTVDIAQTVHDTRVEFQQKAGEKIVTGVKATVNGVGTAADVVTLRHDLKKKLSAQEERIHKLENPHMYDAEGKRIEEPKEEKAPKEQTQSKVGQLFGKVASWFEKKVDAAQQLDDKVDHAKDVVVQTAKDTRDATVKFANDAKDVVVQTAKDTRDATVKFANDAKDYTVEKATQAKEAYVAFDKKTDKMAHDAGQSIGYQMMAKFDRIKSFVTGADTLKDLKQEARAVRAERAADRLTEKVEHMEKNIGNIVTERMEQALRDFRDGKGSNGQQHENGAGNGLPNVAKSGKSPAFGVN